jgi:hypothetical protein
LLIGGKLPFYARGIDSFRLEDRIYGAEEAVKGALSRDGRFERTSRMLPFTASGAQLRCFLPGRMKKQGVSLLFNSPRTVSYSPFLLGSYR